MDFPDDELTLEQDLRVIKPFVGPYGLRTHDIRLRQIFVSIWGGRKAGIEKQKQKYANKESRELGHENDYFSNHHGVKVG